MSHEFWHVLNCGSVGAAGPATSPGQWNKSSTGIVAYKANDPEIANLAEPVVKKIARLIGKLTGSKVGNMVNLPGGYRGVGIGESEGPVDIPPLHSYQDLFLTVIFDAPQSTHEALAATMALITIERAKLYYKVYKRTGGLITLSYGDHGEPG